MTESEAMWLIQKIQQDMPCVKATMMHGLAGRRGNASSKTKSVLLTMHPDRPNSKRSLQIGNFEDYDSIRMAWSQFAEL